MQILESSRPIMKCEHFLILHFQVDISTQKQALGNISKFTAYVCVCVCVCGNKRVCVCVCVCACVPAHCLCSCVKCVRDVTVGFPFYSVCAFFFFFFLAHWSNVCCLLLASNFALSVPALPLANPIRSRKFIG